MTLTFGRHNNLLMPIVLSFFCLLIVFPFMWHMFAFIYLVMFKPANKESILKLIKRTKFVLDHHLGLLLATVSTLALFKLGIQSMVPCLITSIALVIIFFFFKEKLVRAFKENIVNKFVQFCK